MTHQSIWVSLCCLPERGRKGTVKTVEEMKKREE